MSFETTLICDGCSSVFDGGTHRSTTEELRREGGRGFTREGRRRDGDWVELGPDDDWDRGRLRHLAPCCADATQFFDGVPVPTKGQGGTK